MADLIFIQDSRVNRVFFELKADSLEVSQKHLGKWMRNTFLLRNLNGEYDRVRRRLTGLVKHLILLSLPGLWFVRFILKDDIVPRAVITFPAIYLLSLLLAVARCVRPLDCIQFYDQWKRPAFFIIREKKQAAECDAFVQELVDRVERLENDLPAAMAEIPAPLPPRSQEGWSLFRLRENRWLFSVLLGGVAAGVPKVEVLVNFLDQGAYPLVVSAATGGVIFCVLSFMARERWRYASLIGGALSLVPVCFP